ncbi:MULTISPECIES: HD domain-containing protein [Tissierellales]|jgi:putative hydrolase of HD superfamily|uniref:HD domain-containing protein n=1 Tax=Acidilutibacter cellobiosedens TaxID=2507161 RepID=A0A410QBD7_9FIRM|nr:MULTISPECIES: HD domain-containing protein [Tissierellales]MBE6081927.1 HD domain-containing protein [Tissierellaceae bacterium]QAT61270.1 HD domain-containing protein [Acidilutibacter cellobiosedens]SCL96295.1 5'-nucleotidase [Sporanaerobacter sp. PP17-6a]
MDFKELDREIEFIVELDKMKSIFRQTSLINGTRRENDAEHSWHLALMTMILSEYADNKIDEFKVIKMVVIHDLVEIYAGDTFCYDEKGNMDKKERELKAAEKIFGMIPGKKGEELRSLWEEFEAMKTDEALFAASMDRLQPFIMNYNSSGGTWKKFNISKKQILNRIAPLKRSSKVLNDYAERLIEDSFKKGYITKE